MILLSKKKGFTDSVSQTSLLIMKPLTSMYSLVTLHTTINTQRTVRIICLVLFQFRLVMRYLAEDGFCAEHFTPLMEQISKLEEALYNIQFEQHWLEAQTDRQAIGNIFSSKNHICCSHFNIE